ncbi:MAG TPA: bifunctional DNA primase/polymerase [Pirellulales bacterium]|jgi:hypothetical protein
MSTTDPASSMNVARGYIERGWSPLPVPLGSKAPTQKNWQKLRFGPAQLAIFRNKNVGVHLGEPSRGLIDADLDHQLAVELAPQFLPPTQSRFGRSGKPDSHWLYQIEQAPKTHKRKLPKSLDKKMGMIVELRSTGCQTVFPGSKHPSGEEITWTVDGEPAAVDAADLLQAVNALADEVQRRLGYVSRKQSMATNGQHHADLSPDAIKDRARKYIAKIPGAVQHQCGSDATFHVACVLVLGFDLGRSDALELIREWNVTCKPEWS